MFVPRTIGAQTRSMTLITASEVVSVGAGGGAGGASGAGAASGAGGASGAAGAGVASNRGFRRGGGRRLFLGDGCAGEQAGGGQAEERETAHVGQIPFSGRRPYKTAGRSLASQSALALRRRLD